MTLINKLSLAVYKVKVLKVHLAQEPSKEFMLSHFQGSRIFLVMFLGRVGAKPDTNPSLDLSPNAGPPYQACLL